jgi:hypothetical protein
MFVVWWVLGVVIIAFMAYVGVWAVVGCIYDDGDEPKWVERVFGQR